MYIYGKPIRLNSPVKFNYTFKDVGGAIIDLTDYEEVGMDLKLKGEDYSTEDGEFATPKTSGKVRLLNNAGVIMGEVGIWMAQFWVKDADDNKLFAEPVKFEVVKNVMDAESQEVLDH